MNEFDDPDLGRQLRAAAGADPDVAIAQQAVHRRVTRARRRRLAVVSGTAALLLLSVGVVAAVGNGRNNRLISTADTNSLPGNTVQIASTVASEPTTSVDGAPNTGLTTSSTLVDQTTAVPASIDTAATSSPAIDTPTTPSSTGTAGGTVTTKPKAPPSTTDTTAPTVAPAQPVPTTSAGVDETQTFHSFGGSISVRLSGGRLSLVGGPSPAVGFRVDEQDVSATEVEVRFLSADHRSKISVEIQHGHLSGNIEEENVSGGSDEESYSDDVSGSTTSEHSDDD